MARRRIYPVTPAAVRVLWADHDFLDELVELCPIDDRDWSDPIDRSDLWWWLCQIYEQMSKAGRRDLKATARQWAKRIRPAEIIMAREKAETGCFDLLLPDRVRDECN